VPHGEVTAEKWLDSIEKQKRSDLNEQRDRRRYIQTDRVNNKNYLTPRLGAESKTRV